MAWASDVQKLVDSKDIDGMFARLQQDLPLMKQGAYFENLVKNKSGTSTPSSEFVPALPCLQCVATGAEGGEEPPAHRLRKTSVMDQFIDGMVARSVSKNELRSTPKAVEAMLHEWTRFDNKAWSTSKVREWGDVRAEAYKLAKKVHITRVFGICVEKTPSSLTLSRERLRADLSSRVAL